MISNLKLVYGVGINDADYKVSLSEKIGNKYKRVWVCPFYKRWQGMLMRCYAPKYKNNHKTYEGCFVNKSWHRFSTFKIWMEKQDWEGKHLDKDLLFPGNKEYSEVTCCFVSQKINSFIVEAKAIRGDYPIGVHKRPHRSGFVATCCDIDTGKQVYLGYFKNPSDAHTAWLAEKLRQAKILANLVEDERIAKALIARYENYQEDRNEQ